MIKKVKIGGTEHTLKATIWTWLEYKRLFKRDWQADRNKFIAELLKATKFAEKYNNYTDEEFEKLPKEKQDEYWSGLKENAIDGQFTLDTIYAMAIAGGFTGSQKDLFHDASPLELDDNSELMTAYNELIEEFMPNVKKKT